MCEIRATSDPLQVPLFLVFSLGPLLSSRSRSLVLFQPCVSLSLSLSLSLSVCLCLPFSFFRLILLAVCSMIVTPRARVSSLSADRRDRGMLSCAKSVPTFFLGHW